MINNKDCIPFKCVTSRVHILCMLIHWLDVLEHFNLCFPAGISKSVCSEKGQLSIISGMHGLIDISLNLFSFICFGNSQQSYTQLHPDYKSNLQV